MSDGVDEEQLWAFLDACGTWLSQNYGFPRMTGRVLGWLLVCDPAEQTAVQLQEATALISGMGTLGTRAVLP